MINSPYDEGELEVQRLSGELEIAKRMSGIISKVIIPAALEFLTHQAVIWLGVKDHENNHWAFPLFGSPGFIKPNQGESIDIDLDNTFPIPSEWLAWLKPENLIGCLVIELSTRKRLRINGVVKTITKNLLQIEVQQSFPNCPKYIRRRNMLSTSEICKFEYKSKGTVLNNTLETIIRESDTAFVTSSAPTGIDVSHRGGEAGFIKIISPNKLLIPDYKGNSMFSTLGNFKTNPFGGLIIVEFNHGQFLQVSGEIKMYFNNEHPTVNTGGTNRFWELTIHKWQLFKMSNNFKWESYDFSPFNP